MWESLTRGPHGAADPVIENAIRAFAELRAQNEAVVARVAEAHGIGVSDLLAISFIDSAEDATPKRVADALGFTTGATTTLLDRLERAGYVERRANPADRRSVHLALTASGDGFMAGIWGLYSVAFERALAGAEVEQFAADLRAVSTSLGALLAEVGDEMGTSA